MCFVLLSLGGFAQYEIANLQKDQKGELTSLISSGTVTIMNEIIYQFLIFSASKQRKLTQTKVNTNLIIKIGFFLFLNAGVFMLAARIVADDGQLRISEQLVTQIVEIMILNIIVPHVMLFLFSYIDLFGCFRRWIVRRGLTFYTQMSANKAYQKPSM